MWRRLVGALIMSVAVAQTACYEGFEGEYAADEGAPSPPAPEPKPIPYILFEYFVMSADAVTDDDCFPDVGIREYRQNEWASRIATGAAALATLADTLVTVGHSVSASDCETLGTVQINAAQTKPWQADTAPPFDDTLAIHLKAVYWEGDPPTSPPSIVVRAHWAAWQVASVSGANVQSLHYFVVSGADGGYFSEWRDALAASVKLDGMVIEPVDPTPEGLANRAAVIDADGTALAAWVRGFALWD